MAQSEFDPRDGVIRRLQAADSRGASLQTLLSLLRANPSDIELRADAIVAARAAGEDSVAVGLTKDILVASFPTSALPSIGRAARVQGEYALSEVAYAETLKRTPNDIDASVGLALALHAQRKHHEAMQVIDAIPTQANAHHQFAVLEAKAILSASLGKDLDVLQFANAMLAIEADNAAAQRLRFDALIRLGLSEQALRLTPPTLLSREEQASVELNARAREFRLVPIGETDSGYRFRLDGIIDDLVSLERTYHDTSAAERARWDRLTLLNARQRHREARALLDEIFVTRSDYPLWFQETIAQTLLANGEARASLPWFRRVLASDSAEFGTRTSFFYALLEAEYNDEAVAHVNALVEQTRRSENRADALVARVLQIRALLYTDQVSAAHTALASLKTEAPASLAVLEVQAEVEAARGWPRLTGETVAGVLGQYPRDIGATIRDADVLLARGDRAASRAQLDAAIAYAPEQGRLVRSIRERALNDAMLVHVEAKIAETHDVRSYASAGRETRVDGSAYSPWLFDRLRILANTSTARDTRSATDTIIRNAASLGAEVSLLDTSALVQVGGDNQSRFFASARVSYAHNDFLRLQLDLGRDDRELPLRGWRSDTSVTHGRITAQWRSQESSQWSASVGSAWFTDSNHRTDIAATWTQRWLSQAHWRIDSRFDVYALHNKKQNVAYFSPEYRLGVAVGVNTDWIQWRHYDKSLTHRLGATVGVDVQKSVIATGLYAFTYEHAWRLSRCAELRYGVQWTQRGYDGNAEQTRGASIMFEQRLP